MGHGQCEVEKKLIHYVFFYMQENQSGGGEKAEWVSRSQTKNIAESGFYPTK